MSLGPGQIKIFLVANNEGGFADWLILPAGTTVEKLFSDRFPNTRSDSMMIRVNREPAARAQELKSEDRVTITPLKISGAEA